MEFFKKRGVALVVLALAIAGAVFIGQSRKDGFIAKKPTELLDVQYQDWICDEAGLLNGQTEQLIRDYNDSWNSKYYAITAVASIDHLTSWNAEDYAANLGEKWGLGRNDMILLLVKDGDWQVYCGDNVGYTMTDTQQNAAAGHRDHLLQRRLRQCRDGLLPAGGRILRPGEAGRRRQQ